MNHSVTILIVDDNLLNMMLASDLLEYAGYTVLRAASAIDAQLTLKLSKPDLLLLDIQMPGMDGLTFTRLLKADPAYQHIPVVALTAFAMKGDRERILAAGCDGYITKPIDTRNFSGQVAEFLPRKSPPSSP